MRLALHTVVCCCVFATVVPLVRGAAGELDVRMKKRMHSQVRRDLGCNLIKANKPCSDIQGQEELSSGSNSRARRSASSSSAGCALSTCVYHDLLYILSQNKKRPAPDNKICPGGYGRRRRRSVVDVNQLVLQIGRQRQDGGAAPQVDRNTNKCKSP